MSYIVIGRSNGTTRTGSPYCTLRIKNFDEEMTVAVWDVSPADDPVVGQLVDFVVMQRNDGKCSARKTDMLPGAIAWEGHPFYDMLPRPVAKEVWDTTVANLMGMCGDTLLRTIIGDVAQKLYPAYSQYPAAKSIHHAYKGGLLNHTCQMLRMLEGIAPYMPYAIRVDYCTLAILFHDYGKVQTYTREGAIQPEGSLLGHIYISASCLQRELERREVPTADIERIVHIVLAHHGQKEYGSPVLPCSQEAVLVHMLDNLSAQVDTIEQSGDMEYVGTLGTTVVK